MPATDHRTDPASIQSGRAPHAREQRPRRPSLQPRAHRAAASGAHPARGPAPGVSAPRLAAEIRAKLRPRCAECKAGPPALMKQKGLFLDALGKVSKARMEGFRLLL